MDRTCGTLEIPCSYSAELWLRVAALNLGGRFPRCRRHRPGEVVFFWVRLQAAKGFLQKSEIAVVHGLANLVADISWISIVHPNGFARISILTCNPALFLFVMWRSSKWSRSRSSMSTTRSSYLDRSWNWQCKSCLSKARQVLGRGTLHCHGVIHS